MKTLAFAILSSLLCSCATYTHRREDVLGTVETTSVSGLFTTANVSKFRSSVTDSGYKRTISFGTLESAGDTEFLRALYEAGVAAGKAGAP